jgi:hypothetical protein
MDHEQRERERRRRPLVWTSSHGLETKLTSPMKGKRMMSSSKIVLGGPKQVKARSMQGSWKQTGSQEQEGVTRMALINYRTKNRDAF